MNPKYLTKYNKFRIANLFIETANRDGLYDDTSRDIPVFTLGPEDNTDSLGNLYISMHKLFIEEGDVTGYTFSLKVLGSYEHLVQLSEHKVIGPHVKAWKRELKAMIDSKAMKEIQRIATKGGTQVELSAAKYLANREYEGKSDSAGVGKPATNNAKRKAETHAKATANDTKAEMKRLGMIEH